MPEKVFPTPESFQEFEKELLRRKFQEITSEEVRREFQRLNLKAPRPRPGRETGYRFRANDLMVIAWTTWLKEEQRAREEDAGWVLIAHEDKPLYFTYPLNRTKNFLQRLFLHACIARFRIIHRPLCPKCNQYADIARGKWLKSRFWRCGRKELHDTSKVVNINWDYPLLEALRDPTTDEGLKTILRYALKFLKRERKRRRRYRERRRKEGKEVFVALRKRKLWR